MDICLACREVRIFISWRAALRKGSGVCVHIHMYWSYSCCSWSFLHFLQVTSSNWIERQRTFISFSRYLVNFYFFYFLFLFFCNLDICQMLQHSNTMWESSSSWCLSADLAHRGVAELTKKKNAHRG